MHHIDIGYRQVDDTKTNYPLIMRACSSIKFPSPITMGPASAMIRALGWTTVLGPTDTKPYISLWFIKQCSPERSPKVLINCGMDHIAR